MTKRALIVSPYLDHLGGGERYMLAAASTLENLGYEIFLAWDNVEEITQLAEMLGIALQKPQLDSQVKELYFHHNPLKMFVATKKYDVTVYLSDGSIPLLGSKKNIVHMQVPFHGVSGRSWKNNFKKMCIDTFIVNSSFTKSIVDHEYGINSKILFPPVQVITNQLPKENIILSVGRFEQSLNAKKHDILIQTWRALGGQIPTWKLVLAGGSSNDAWINELKKMADGFKIEFVVNASYRDLCELYARSAIYWHAAGYGIDQMKNPELTEHFGISTVEAISAGCIPLVVPSGGQGEIVQNPDLQWNTKEELITKTLSLINNQNRSELLKEISIGSYTQESFAQNLSQLIK